MDPTFDENSPKKYVLMVIVLWFVKYNMKYMLCFRVLIPRLEKSPNCRLCQIGENPMNDNKVTNHLTHAQTLLIVNIKYKHLATDKYTFL